MDIEQYPSHSALSFRVSSHLLDLLKPYSIIQSSERLYIELLELEYGTIPLPSEEFTTLMELIKTKRKGEDHLYLTVY